MIKDIDKDLLLLLKSDKNRGFRLLFEKYHMCLCLYVLQITDDFEESEDIVQDFFVHFWESNIEKQIHDNLRSYLFKCVRNSAYSWLAKNKEIKTYTIDEQLENIFDPDDFDSEEYSNKEKELRKAVETLPEQERKALFEVIMKNHKYKEAAETLGISVNTLKTHLSRALKSLRKNDNLKFLIFIFILHMN